MRVCSLHKRFRDVGVSVGCGAWHWSSALRLRLGDRVGVEARVEVRGEQGSTAGLEGD